MLLYYWILYLFSFEYCITKSQIITTAKHNKEKIMISQRELEAKTRKQPKARENACNQVVISLSIESDWLSKWREFSEPIT